MTHVRTSATHPLEIAEVATPVGAIVRWGPFGRIGPRKRP